MKSILKTVAGIAIAVILALGIAGCNNNVDSHEHTFAEEWTSDATHHWHAATCEHTTEVKDKAEHSFGEWTVVTVATEEAEGKKTRKCEDCEYVAEEVIPQLEHTHTFATEWTSDATHHWHAATCEHTTEVKDKAEHSFGEWTSNNDATTWADGTKSKTCTVCQYKESVADEGTKLQKPDFTSCVAGDFVLKNGTVLSKDQTPENGTVAAVIVRAAANGKPALGVGIVHNRTELAWCKSSAVGYSTNITALKGDISSGYMDGSDGWEKLKAVCSDAEAHPEYYPAWNFCLTYAEKNDLNGDLAKGWYLPTVAELYTIYQNKTAVDESLSKAGGSQFSTGWYWSCCQNRSFIDHAGLLFFSDGSMGYAFKYDPNIFVCSVRAFN